MSKHTPGPWSAFVAGKTVAVDIGASPTGIGASPTGKNPCIVHWMGFDCCDLPFAKRVANAYLIAAAPAMLEALEAMLEVHGVRWEHVRGDSSIPASWVELSDKARAAIKAAKGEA